MKWWHSDERVTATRAFLLSSISGAFPFSFQGNRTQINYKLLFYFFLSRILVGVLTSCTLYHMSYDFAFDKDYIHIQYVAMFFTNCFCYFLLYLKRKDIDSLLEQYEEADEEFQNLGLEPDPKINLCFDYFILLVCVSPLPFAAARAEVYLVLKTACHAFMYWSHYMLVQPFIKLVINLIVRIRTVQGALLRSYRCKFEMEKIQKLKRLGQLFHLLCSTCDIVNGVFSFQLLIVFTMALVSSVINTYYTIMSIIYVTRNDTTGKFIKRVALLIFYNFICLAITTICKNTSHKVKQFTSLLYQLMVYDKTSIISNNKKLRLHISMKREVVFTAFGIFRLDYTLVHTMIATAATHLVILIQFHDQHSTANAAHSLAPDALPVVSC